MSFNLEQNAYLSLRNIISERTSSIVAWVGSGLSAPLGIPTWTPLKRRLIQALNDKSESLAPNDRPALQRHVAAIIGQGDLWIAFEMLQKHLGAATFRDTIREAVRPADTADPPASYRYLWHLRIRGLINLNIDRLATKACVQETGNKTPLEFTGAQGTQLGFLLKENRPFILNLHGHADDSSTWVFTKSQLENLIATPSYGEFIRSCLLSNTILFLGLSADDLAVGGHLEALAKLQIQSGTHYWVTSRADLATDKWAEAVGVRVIRYEAPADDHSALDEMFEDLLAFVPPEDPPETMPVVSSSASLALGGLPAPEELAKGDAEVIRRTLNSFVQRMLERGKDTDREYSQFLRDYDEAIHRGWYVSTIPGRNKLLGYELQSEAAKGAFGTVYQAVGSSGEPLAIKVLLVDIRKDPALLQSFRRGVRSMRILSKHKVDGVVEYRDSSEIPAFAVMDWVEGPSLQEAVQSKLLQGWDMILRVGKHLSRIVRHAHELPERVLHRDLRPSNVMLKNFYTDPQDWRVVVLDFDLSWHRGSTEKSVVFGSTLYGYLAPEQIQRLHGVSTRHSAVDSFGLGMTLFFMVSGRHPVPDEHRHDGWSHIVRSACHAYPSTDWRSLPDRFARLILNATHDAQAKRWDLAQIENELTRLLEAAVAPQSVDTLDLLVEELATRTSILTDHTWDEDTGAACRELPTGLRVRLRGEARRRALALEVDWGATGVQEYRKVGKWLVPAAETCAAILRSAGWKVTPYEYDTGVLRLEASIDAETVRRGLTELPPELDRAMERLRLP
jgi:serine/threonine protein kinase